MQRLAVVIDPDKGAFKVVAGKREVVRITAKERRHLLRREDYADILIALVFVEIVATAFVERDDFTAHVGCSPTGTLDLGFCHTLGIVEFTARSSSRGGVHVLGDISDLHQLIGFKFRASLFFRACASVKAVRDVVVLCIRKIAQALAYAVVVGHNEPIG